MVLAKIIKVKLFTIPNTSMSKNINFFKLNKNNLQVF